MSEYLLIKFLHVVGFAYWLGGDLGVFHSSYWVANSNHSPEVRVAAARILFWLDQVPRICMTMMLPLGVHLAWRLNVLPIDATITTIVWIVCFAWLAWVIYLHAGKSSGTKAFVTRFDLWFRLLLSLSLLGGGIAALLGLGWSLPHWVAIKLKNFGPAFARIASGDVDDDVNRTIQSSLGGTRPFVVAIWIGLFASAALGLHLI